MSPQEILISLVVFIVLFILEILFYQTYLLTKNNLRAYIKELENKNPELLVQTKVKVVSKQREYIIVCKYKKEEIDVICDTYDTPLEIVKSAYIYKNKYYLKPVKGEGEKISVKPLYIKDTYKLKLNDRGYIFERSLKNKMEINKEIIMYKKPFTGEYLTEYEIGDKEVLTEVELMEMLPNKMDKYFFDYKEMNAIKTGNFSIPLSLFFILPSLCSLAIIVYAIVF